MTAAVAAPPTAVWKALARRISQPGRERMKVFDPETKAYLKTRRITDTLPKKMVRSVKSRWDGDIWPWDRAGERGHRGEGSGLAS